MFVGKKKIFLFLSQHHNNKVQKSKLTRYIPPITEASNDFESGLAQKMTAIITHF